MKFQVKSLTPYQASAVPLRCPHCNREAAFAPLSNLHDIDVGDGIWCGQRQCPNQECRGHVFVVSRQGRVIQAYPPARIDFNTDSIPPKVLKTFDEAITAHSAGCFVASALMVRRTLEEVCLDKGASGDNLKARISDLRSKIVIPNELFAALDELRLLGNDAAHVEAKSYDEIGDAEVSVAIEFTKELLKALYQYSGLLSKLRALKKSS